MSPIKYGWTFILKAFRGRWRTIHWGAFLYGRLISDHAKGGEVSQIQFSVIIFMFPTMKVYALEDKGLNKIMEVFIPKVNS